MSLFMTAQMISVIQGNDFPPSFTFFCTRDTCSLAIHNTELGNRLILYLHKDILKFSSPDRCCVIYSGPEIRDFCPPKYNGGGGKICLQCSNHKKIQQQHEIGRETDQKEIQRKTADSEVYGCISLSHTWAYHLV